MFNQCHDGLNVKRWSQWGRDKKNGEHEKMRRFCGSCSPHIYKHMGLVFLKVVETSDDNSFDDDDSFEKIETSCRPFSLGEAGVRDVQDAIGSVMSPSSQSSPSML